MRVFFLSMKVESRTRLKSVCSEEADVVEGPHPLRRGATGCTSTNESRLKEYRKRRHAAEWRPPRNGSSSVRIDSHSSIQKKREGRARPSTDRDESNRGGPRRGAGSDAAGPLGDGGKSFPAPSHRGRTHDERWAGQKSRPRSDSVKPKMKMKRAAACQRFPAGMAAQASANFLCSSLIGHCSAPWRAMSRRSQPDGTSC